MEDNSLTYELYLPKDSRVRVSTVLGNGSKDSFVLSLNGTQVTLENYIQTANSDISSMKSEGEYILISKNMDEHTYKVRRFIYDSDQIASILPLHGRFRIEYENQILQSLNSIQIGSSESIFLRMDAKRRELDEDGGEGGGNLILHGIGCYAVWTLLSYLMIISGRYMRYFNRWRMIFHIVLGIAILILSIISNKLSWD